VAVDESERHHDMYDARLGPHDQRVQRGGWDYYIRAVKWEQDFTARGVQPGGELIVDALRLVARGVRRARSSRRPWVVGVVRIGDVATWNDRTPRVVCRETLGARQEPPTRIAELVVRAQNGEYAPAPQ
jgi:hypothetical protein